MGAGQFADLGERGWLGKKEEDGGVCGFNRGLIPQCSLCLLSHQDKILKLNFQFLRIMQHYLR